MKNNKIKRNIILMLMAGIFCSLLLAGIKWHAGVAHAQEPVVITFWHAMGGFRGEVLNELVTKFNQTHPNIRVEPRYVKSTDKFSNDYNALYREILYNLAQGKPPVVTQVYENWTVQLIEAKAIVPMEDFIKRTGGLSQADLDDFIPIFLKANKYDGKIWTLPFNKSIYVLFYNKEAFKEKGLTPPKTWQELRSVAKKLTGERKGKMMYGLVFSPSVDIFGHWLLANGGAFIKNNYAVFNDKIGKQDMEFWYKIVNDDESALISFDAYKDFLDEKSAMYIETTSKWGSIKNKAKFQFGTTYLPIGTTKKYQFAGTNLAIFSSATPEQKKAAWEFVKWLTSKDNTAYWALKTGYLPVRTSAVNSSEYKEFLMIEPDMMVGIKALEYAEVQPRIAQWESIRGILDDAVFDVVTKKIAPSAALDKAAELSNKHLGHEENP